MSTGIVLIFSFALAVACKMSRSFKYYVKFIFFTITSLIFATIFIPWMLWRPRDSKNALLPAWGCRWSAKLLGIFYDVRGHENIVPEGQGCVVLMNHQSALDLIVLAHLWPIMPKCCQISKKEVFWLWPFGLAVWLWGTVFIDKMNPEKAQDIINKTGAYINSKQARILMFPEGTRHQGDTLLPLKKGAFHLALAAQCPIQPVAVSRYHFLDSKTNRFDMAQNIIEILPAIPTKGLTKEDLPELMEKARISMQEAYSRLSIEVVQRKKTL